MRGQPQRESRRAYPGCRPTGPRPRPHSPTGPPPPGYASRQPCPGLPPRTTWPRTSNTQPGPPNLLHGPSLYLHRIQAHRPRLPRGLASSLEQKQGNPITVFQILSPPHPVLGTRPSLPDNRLNPWGTFGVHGFRRKPEDPVPVQSVRVEGAAIRPLPRPLGMLQPHWRQAPSPPN